MNYLFLYFTTVGRNFEILTSKVNKGKNNNNNNSFLPKEKDFKPVRKESKTKKGQAAFQDGMEAFSLQRKEKT